MNKKISVTIPVYNVEPNYIENAINSVINQTYENIEIIVVNDGSTDINTIEYLKSINNPKVKIVNQENKGLGGARNTGIANSTGEYIGFLDADDWLDANFYEVLYNLCEENGADIACGTLTRTGIDYQKPMDHFDNNFITDFVEKMQYITNGSTCSKLFKKELFSNVRFKEHTYYEDNPVLVETLAKSDKVAFTNTVKYYYRENPKSICLNPEKKEKRKADRLYMLQEICNIISNKSQNEKDAVLSVFTPILVDGEAYNSDKEYQNTVKILLGVNYKKYLLKTKNSFIENIFSLKNSAGKTHKIITILWIKFKIKRKPKNHA
jgi:glycosyltransferase involved in cell wall biosynthesis